MLDVAVPQGDQELFGPLSVERGLRFVKVGEAKRRLLELVYCECCGEMFFAGMKGKRRDSSYLDLLPIDPDLDGLPDAAMSRLFEELTAESFSVFWPSTSGPTPAIGNRQSSGEWRKACLEPVTGVVRIANNRFDPWASPSHIHGFLYMRSATRDRHGRSSSDAGSCVPYACPACGISYERRKRGYRLSPLRNFRTGFAKTTQLLATEVFEVLGKTSDNPKLVSFSDSRQDAAKAALDIERRHHEDLSRQILVETIIDVAKARPTMEALRSAEEKTKKAVFDADPNDPTADELTVELKRLRQLIRSASDPSIQLSEIVETLGDPHFYGLRPDRNLLRPYLAKFADLGVHPV